MPAKYQFTDNQWIGISRTEPGMLTLYATPKREHTLAGGTDLSLYRSQITKYKKLFEWKDSNCEKSQAANYFTI